MSCQKAQGFLARRKVTTKSTTDAKKAKHDLKQALALTKDIDKIITSKGETFTTLDLKRDQPDKTTLLAALLGPSGNLRAPTFRKGKTLVVGFSEEVYKKLFG
jgi:arsenate reductase-like glutaredoxin family protein